MPACSNASFEGTQYCRKEEIRLLGDHFTSPRKQFANLFSCRDEYLCEPNLLLITANTQRFWVRLFTIDYWVHYATRIRPI